MSRHRQGNENISHNHDNVNIQEESAATAAESPSLPSLLDTEVDDDGNNKIANTNANAIANTSRSSSSTPARIHRTVSAAEFKKILKQFQVQLPPLSFIPDWVDEYSDVDPLTSTSTNTSAGSESERTITDESGKDQIKADLSYVRNVSEDIHVKMKTDMNGDITKVSKAVLPLSLPQAQALPNDTNTTASKSSAKQKQFQKTKLKLIDINLPSLPNDVASYILSFVPNLADILSYSQTCRGCYRNGYNNDLVWKVRFHQRWNVTGTDSGVGDGGGNGNDNDSNTVDASAMIDPIYKIYEDALQPSKHQKRQGQGRQQKDKQQSSTTNTNNTKCKT
jgi:hypothetical protein